MNDSLAIMRSATELRAVKSHAENATAPTGARASAHRHHDLVALADRELSLQAIDSILRLTAEDGELLSVAVRCHLAPGCCYVQTADRTLGRCYEHTLEADGRCWYLGRADLLHAHAVGRCA